MVVSTEMLARMVQSWVLSPTLPTIFPNEDAYLATLFTFIHGGLDLLPPAHSHSMYQMLQKAHVCKDHTMMVIFMLTVLPLFTNKYAMTPTSSHSDQQNTITTPGAPGAPGALGAPNQLSVILQKFISTIPTLQRWYNDNGATRPHGCNYITPSMFVLVVRETWDHLFWSHMTSEIDMVSDRRPLSSE